MTALTSAMYVDDNGKEVTLKNNSGGLYAQNRFTDMARIDIPSHMLAFQTGESTQIHTGGYLEATPHCVIRNEEIAGKKIARDTFALFMEPNNLKVMKTPNGILPDKVYLTKSYKIPQLKERWDNGIFFKEFYMRSLKQYS